MAWLDMRKKKQVTVRVTEQFAQDLNLLAASYGLDNVSYIVQQSVACQAAYVRQRFGAARQDSPDVV